MTISSLFSRLVLALTLATGAGAALAVPTTYHVTLDTSTFSGDGYIDVSLGSLLGYSGVATAVVSNATGALTSTTDVIGTVNGDLTTTASFTSDPYGDVAQLVHLGGMFGFDVLLDAANIGTGVTFAIGLLDSNFNSLLATNFAAQIDLATDGSMSFITFTPFATATVVDAAAVPEPGQWLLMLTGLLLLGAMARRRNM